ncbi:prokineticin receptor 2-like isoform X2 [Antedon mediterranea]|uniref:prokineticin receptor 2-like isoform X2 n=1 Tax=Antedon mediterranea TaxID=105859 RepID=UPI003AF42923
MSLTQESIDYNLQDMESSMSHGYPSFPDSDGSTYPFNDSYLNNYFHEDMPCHSLFGKQNLIIKLIIVTLYVLIIFVCGIGNSFLIIIILSRRRLRSVTNLLIANLAFSDLLLAIWCAPFNFHFKLTENWIFGTVLCKIMNTVMMISMFASVNTLLVISIDRYHGIFHPLRPRMRKSTLTIIIILIWVVSFLVCIPTLLYANVSEAYDCNVERDVATCAELWGDIHPNIMPFYFVFITFFEFLVPMLVMSFIYVRIALQLWLHRAPPGYVTSERQREITSIRKQKTIPMLITVVVAFGICWSPWHAYNLAQVFHFKYNVDKFQSQVSVYSIVEGIAIFNCVFNTIVYFALSPVFRKELRSIFLKKCPMSRRRPDPGSVPKTSNATGATRTPSQMSQLRNGYNMIKKTETNESKV